MAVLNKNDFWKKYCDVDNKYNFISIHRGSVFDNILNRLWSIVLPSYVNQNYKFYNERIYFTSKKQAIDYAKLLAKHINAIKDLMLVE